MGLFKIDISNILLVLLILGILCIILIRSLVRWRGIVVEGNIFDRGEQYSRFGTIYYLIYSYQYKGKTYTHRQRVNEDTYHIWSEGGNAEVYCLPMFAYITRLNV